VTVHRIAALVATLALAVPPLAAAQAVEPQASLPDIEDEVMCIVCGVPLELATEAPQANQERDFIRELIDKGLTKDEIKDRLVAEFGSEVLATPDSSGFDLAAWLVPGIAILAALVGIVIGLRRWRGTGPGDGGSDGRAGPEPAMNEADSERLDADLARYEL